MSAQMSVKSHTITPFSTLLTLTLAWTPAQMEGWGGGKGAAQTTDEALLSSERTVSKAVTFLICVFGPNNLVGFSQSTRKYESGANPGFSVAGRRLFIHQTNLIVSF